MPNTPMSGVNGAHEVNIRDAVNDIQFELLYCQGLARKDCHCIIDPDSVYSPTQKGVIDFSLIMSSSRRAGEYCSLFSRGSMYKRSGVPELVKLMDRNEFIDMSNNLSAASHGSSGNEIERNNTGIAGGASTKAC